MFQYIYLNQSTSNGFSVSLIPDLMISGTEDSDLIFKPKFILWITFQLL